MTVLNLDFLEYYDPFQSIFSLLKKFVNFNFVLHNNTSFLFNRRESWVIDERGLLFLAFTKNNQNFPIFANIKECASYSLKSPISPNVYTRHSERPYSWAVRLCVYTGVWRYLTSTRGRQPTFRLIKHCNFPIGCTWKNR